MVLCMRKVLVRSVQVLCIKGITAAENVTEKVKKWEKNSHIMAIFDPRNWIIDIDSLEIFFSV